MSYYLNVHFQGQRFNLQQNFYHTLNSRELMKWLLIHLNSVDNDGLTKLNSSLYGYRTCTITSGDEVS